MPAWGLGSLMPSGDGGGDLRDVQRRWDRFREAKRGQGFWGALGDLGDPMPADTSGDFGAALANSQQRTALYRQLLRQGMAEPEAVAELDRRMPQIQNSVTQQIGQQGYWINPNYRPSARANPMAGQRNAPAYQGGPITGQPQTGWVDPMAATRPFVPPTAPENPPPQPAPAGPSPVATQPAPTGLAGLMPQPRQPEPIPSATNQSQTLGGVLTGSSKSASKRFTEGR